MGTPLGPKYIPYTYMDPLGVAFLVSQDFMANGGDRYIGQFALTAGLRIQHSRL